ncbi:diaminopimelate decarboxylase [Sinorhizobium medicae]|uniref:diaminopimelate decarboxylase n=1 Tax=Sinorhizobium medicae TaxID=110321 RepID=UPI001295C65C|nr:diaminopimelate decarboxylase [Sinorhizobium medicae]MQV49883.1 diaminopimelate decarboxylase [Sinorhizobium medicae]MQV55668.1 diaminopimelate decarboxylase [Sinorhizobium medicae]MQV75333.1 diaminopimelate decarboxylase [Sinorhizobium medicae]
MTNQNNQEQTTPLTALQHDSFGYLNGELFVEGLSLAEIADKVPTPFYCYSAASIRNAYTLLSDRLEPTGASICFAVKASSNISVLRLLSELGSGMDIVSGGELERALAAGVSPSKIVFSGVGKTRAEIARALKAGIQQINVESCAELEVIRDVARNTGCRASVVFRVNPDVDAQTHAKISTGKKGDKFGIAIEDIPDIYAKAAEATGLDVAGLAVHIGSQLLDLSPYRAAYHRLATLVEALRSKGLSVPRLDLGGGLGIDYHLGVGPDVGEYSIIIQETVGHLGCELTVEPGRWLVGPAGMLVTEVLYLKETGDRVTAIVDAAMNDLMRPALYGAIHPVLPIKSCDDHAPYAYNIVGPVCETSDAFGSYCNLPKLHSGDRIAFACAGAYGASMASSYNSRDLVAEVLVDGDRFRLIRRRQTIDDLLALEKPTPMEHAFLRSRDC